MAYTLNTGHALYGNLIELIGVQGGALVSHKTARTFTPESGSSFGTGTYGEHFSCVENGFSTKGASFTPGLAVATNTTTSYTVLLVFNSTGAVSSNGVSMYLSRPGGGTVIRSPGKNSSNNVMSARAAGAAIGTGARMLTLCRIGETAEKIYNNKVKDVDATGLPNDWMDSDAQATFLGGWNGQYSMSADLVWAAFFNKELSSAEISDLYDSLGASNTFALISSGDSTAPTLSSASVTAVGTTTATGNVTTNEGNGTLYGIVSTSSTAPSAAQIQAGNDHTGAGAVWYSGPITVSSTGAKTTSITGLTASTSYYAHFQHKDSANNNSSVVTSAQFTMGSADTTNPTMTGSVTISAKTTTSYTASWSAGSDNVAVTGYEYRLNAGSWVDLGAVLTVNISARTPGATDTFEVRAYDAAGNKATALSQSVTLFIGTITIPAVKDWGTGNLKTAQTGVQVDIHNISTGALVVRKTGQTTHATTGVCVVQDAAIADATTYEVITRFADGSKGMWDYTASLT